MPGREQVRNPRINAACLVLSLTVLLSAPAFSTAVSAGETNRRLAGRRGESAAEQLTNEAKSLVKQKRYSEAIPILQEAASYDSRSAEIHFYLGSAYYHTKELEKAIAEYETVLRLEPRTAEATFNIGSCYENLRRYDDALKWYEKYVNENPSASDVADVRRNIEEIKKDMEVRRLFKESHNLLEQKRSVDARFLLERAAQLQPDAAEIHYNLGMAYHNSGNLPKAIEEFKRSLELKPDMTDAILNIGSSYQALGQKAEAIPWFQKYLQANPSASDYKAVGDMIKSLQAEMGKQASDDPHGPDFWASVTRKGIVRRWPQAKLPIKIYIDPGNGVSGMRDSFKQILVSTFDAWIKASQGRLGYRLVSSKDQADLACDWTANPGDVTGEGTESEQGVAHVYGRDSGNGQVEIARATIRILTVDKEKEGDQAVTDEVMKKTCLHEIGHALGLMGHSPNSHDVMFFSESPTVWPVLSKRDKATLLRLYENYPPSFGLPQAASPQ